ncbi:MAG: ATP phosphoribosyltransferase [Chloroflexota bacterium]
MPLKIALPKGRLLRKTAALLQRAGWGLDEYHSRISFYHPRAQRFPDLVIKVFQEKDIPVQVAIGNYDLGICGRDWMQELVTKYRSSALVMLRELGYGKGALYAAAGAGREAFPARGNGVVRIASEYPNLAETFALKQRLSRFNIFPVWGAAEGYPPENAELALVSVGTEAELGGMGLAPVQRVLETNAVLIAHQDSWQRKDLGEIVASLEEALVAEPPAAEEKAPVPIMPPQVPVEYDEDAIRLALPDGHQQQPTLELLQRAGIGIEDYPSETGNRRPRIGLEGVTVKVIRPQDMPLQVANDGFDLAVTGRDWVREHRNQFPSSPVRALADLKFGWVKIVAVVSQDLPVNDAASLREYSTSCAAPLRVASEYTHIADKYARDNHLGNYRIVPTWGATEAFLPEDADMLIENAQTGRTIVRHNLRIIDTLFDSTACLAGSTMVKDGRKAAGIDAIVKRLHAAVEEA